MDEGKIVEGRLFIDKTMGDKTYGFVKVDPIYLGEDEEPFYMNHVKVWGIRHLNRCFHLDKVYVRFVNWIDWGKVGTKITNQIDFEEWDKLQTHGQVQMIREHLSQKKASEDLENFKSNLA